MQSGVCSIYVVYYGRDNPENWAQEMEEHRRENPTTSVTFGPASSPGEGACILTNSVSCWRFGTFMSPRHGAGRSTKYRNIPEPSICTLWDEYGDDRHDIMTTGSQGPEKKPVFETSSDANNDHSHDMTTSTPDSQDFGVQEASETSMDRTNSRRHSSISKSQAICGNPQRVQIEEVLEELSSMFLRTSLPTGSRYARREVKVNPALTHQDIAATEAYVATLFQNQLSLPASKQTFAREKALRQKLKRRGHLKQDHACNQATLSLSLKATLVFFKEEGTARCSNAVSDTHGAHVKQPAVANNPLVRTKLSQPVTKMPRIFFYASNFNQDLSSWNTSSVTDMSYMFWGASKFNQPLNTWNTSSSQLVQRDWPGLMTTLHRPSIQYKPGYHSRGDTAYFEFPIFLNRVPFYMILVFFPPFPKVHGGPFFGGGIIWKA
eukprot:g27045.t1